MGWLDAFTGAASKKASAATVAGLEKGNEAIGWGGENARDRLQKVGKLYKPMTGFGLEGVNAYRTALGMGPEGMEGATEAFRDTPGYQFALEQGEDSVMRNAAARGMLAGGNTSADLMKYGTGLADQTYGNYLSRLNPLMQMYGQGIGGQATAGTNMANTYMDEARARAGIQGQIGQANAGGIMGAANAQAGTLQSGLGLVGQIAGFGTGGGGTIGSDALGWLRGRFA